jgi:predicted Zn finger-like uncharacterized protein
MTVHLLCPNLKCRAVLQVSEKTRGKKVRCGQCGTTFLVPAKPSGTLKAIPGPSTAPPKE